MYRIATTALAALSITAGANAQAPYQLIYDPATGTLTIDTLGGDLHSFTISTTPQGEIFTGFDVLSYIPLPDNFVGAPPPTPSQIVGLNLLGWMALPPTNIGAILPPGLTQSELESILEDAVYVPALGIGGTLPQFQITGGIEVPEPSTVLLMAAGGLLIARRRRDAA